MTFILAPMCSGCQHKREGLTCDAFPERIPDAILFSEVDHRQPVDGDQGIQFAPKTPDDAAYAERIFSKQSTPSAE